MISMQGNTIDTRLSQAAHTLLASQIHQLTMVYVLDCRRNRSSCRMSTENSKNTQTPHSLHSHQTCGCVFDVTLTPPPSQDEGPGPLASHSLTFVWTQYLLRLFGECILLNGTTAILQLRFVLKTPAAPAASNSCHFSCTTVNKHSHPSRASAFLLPQRQSFLLLSDLGHLSPLYYRLQAQPWLVLSVAPGSQAPTEIKWYLKLLFFLKYKLSLKY